MLEIANHWVEIAAAAIDLALLARVLLLKLHRTYLFITLACVLAVFFDGVALWLNPRSREFSEVFVYSRFLYAFVLPAAAFDVWEEVKALVARLRRVATFRLVSSLLLASIFGFVIASFAGNDENGDEPLITIFAIILWAASTTASLAFLWSMHRTVRTQKIELPNNTFVWLIYNELSLVAEVLACFFIILSPLFKTPVGDVLDMFLNIYGVAITAWCIWRLRALPSSVPSAPENVSL